MQHKINFPVKNLHGAPEEHIEVLHACGIGRDDFAPGFFRQVSYSTHPDCYGSVGQNQACTLGMRLFSNMPGNGFVIQGPENNSFLALQQVCDHDFTFSVSYSQFVQLPRISSRAFLIAASVTLLPLSSLATSTTLSSLFNNLTLVIVEWSPSSL